jgi:glutathione S-transferase
MKLYYVPITRAFRVRWLLEEAGEPYELARISFRSGEHKRPEYLAVHPLGSVPALVDGDLTIVESNAICMYIADKHIDKGLAPSLGTKERAAYYQWMEFATATLEPLIDPAFHRGLWAKPEERATVATADDHSKLARAAAPVAAVIEKQGFLAGPGLTAADIVLGGVLQWADSVDLLRDLATLKGYLTKLRERPAFARAVAD